MKTLKQQIKQTVILIILGVVLTGLNLANANSDKAMQDKLLRAKEMTQMGNHADMPSKGPDFKGVYYGYYPCDEADCSGIKITLSLKRNNSYLKVTQPAKPSSREYYEKGKFTWDDEKRIVALQPKDKPSGNQFRIVDEGTLILLKDDGVSVAGDEDAYTLKRGDTMNSREMHIH